MDFKPWSMPNDLVCFSHLRWNFVYQRPQHLLSRFAKERRVFYFEEPLFDAQQPFFDLSQDEPSGVFIVVPHLPSNLSAQEGMAALRAVTDALFLAKHINEYVLWYYSPMAYGFTAHLDPLMVIYDCMDELSAFKNAPPQLVQYERELLVRADLVFTGGHSLYEAKKSFHDNIHAMPSAIDKNDFFPARTTQADPEDQQSIPHPRMGFYGVIDERFDIELLGELAALKPDWQFIILGPVVKIDQSLLPNSSNIHYPGGKSYKQLPAYVANWDVCIMPFALNESTRFISPTKTPEFLAAGKPVVSTAIQDVVEPYGNKHLVSIASTPGQFVECIEKVLTFEDRTEWLGRVDHFLSGISWDKTFSKMNHLVEKALVEKKIPHLLNTEAYV